MARYTPNELADRLSDGLLSFPVTAFDADHNVDESAYRAHVSWQSGYGVAGLFAAGGTGEGFSLTADENRRVIRAAVDAAHEDVPVLGSAGGATREAVLRAQDAEAAGAEGLLLLPPYLTECSQPGLFAHASEVLSATRLGVVLYNRGNAVYSPSTVARLAERHANLIGFKDGIGNIEHLAKVYARNGERLFYLGGLPTAETFALPLLQMGMSTYSSAIFNFAPEFALEFYRDVRAQDRSAVNAKLASFVLPYLDIRDRSRGYGVSIIKAGLRAVGRDAGPVRPPLHDLTPIDQADLEALLDATAIARVAPVVSAVRA